MGHDGFFNRANLGRGVYTSERIWGTAMRDKLFDMLAASVFVPIAWVIKALRLSIFFLMQMLVALISNLFVTGVRLYRPRHNFRWPGTYN